MSKCKLSVPPKSPVRGDIWIREDGVKFYWTTNGWIRNV